MALTGLRCVVELFAAQGDLVSARLSDALAGIALAAAMLVFVAVWLLQRLQLVITQDMVSQSSILRFFVDHSPMDWITSL